MTDTITLPVLDPETRTVTGEVEIDDPDLVRMLREIDEITQDIIRDAVEQAEEEQ